ncbi:hypothetical protein [Fodinibius sediminis]|nr:hypothetical protein [Fodinibius sediminis]
MSTDNQQENRDKENAWIEELNNILNSGIDVGDDWTFWRQAEDRVNRRAEELKQQREARLKEAPAPTLKERLLRWLGLQ